MIARCQFLVSRTLPVIVLGSQLPSIATVHRMKTTYQREQVRRLWGIPTVLLPPVVFSGLVVALWTWKCAMMVVFQNKIIYMPGLPPNARREKISDYSNQCMRLEWTERRIRSEDGTKISLCVSEVETAQSPVKTVYILYFQGGHWFPAI